MARMQSKRSRESKRLRQSRANSERSHQRVLTRVGASKTEDPLFQVRGNGGNSIRIQQYTANVPKLRSLNNFRKVGSRNHTRKHGSFKTSSFIGGFNKMFRRTWK